MNFLDIVLIGIGLSMDAVAITMTNSMVIMAEGNCSCQKKRVFLMPVFFGFFQALMPLIGFYAGGLFAELISKYSGIVSFIILAFVGGNMIKEAFSKDEEYACNVLSIKSLLLQAVATSIDAFAIGVSFSFKQENFSILFAVLVIGITTFLCSWAAIYLGKFFGEKLKDKAEIFGGVILILIGIKALLGF